MVLKIFKAVWFLSVLVTLATLLYNYASLPDSVVVMDDGIAPFRVSRDAFFYNMAGIIGLVNVMVYVVSRFYKSNIDFRTWFHGLVIAINLFFVIALNFIVLFNSSDRFDYKRIEFIIYGSIGLFLVWAIGWPFFVLYKKLFIKESV